MSVTCDHASLIFLFQADNISSALIDTAKDLNVRVAFDLGSENPSVHQTSLLVADASQDVVDLKIFPDVLSDPKLGPTLREIDVRRIWLDMEPVSALGDKNLIYEQITELASDFEIVPILSDLSSIREIIKDHPEITSIAIKGNEAAGFSGPETLLTLFSTVSSLVKQSNSHTNIFIWGGISFPEVAAAFLACGAKGIVFESLHWLTDMVNLDEDFKKRIENIRPDHTELIGANLDVYLRVFNKGNSTSVKDLKDFVGSLCGAEIRDEQRISFIRHVLKNLTHPLKSKFGKDELIPLGTEATFAASFVRRYGFFTEQAIEKFSEDIEKYLSAAPERAKSFVKSPTAEKMGTEYPFIQGAMSWITDSMEFASGILESGALPTLALGLMDSKTLNSRFSELENLLGDRPYAVNIITLSENPFRDEQVEWVKSKKPRFAVIAAGEPSNARGLISDGIEAIYIAPNEELLRLALENGIQFVVLEGHESGGHVGVYSTVTLVQAALDLKSRRPELFKDSTIIFAGGFFNRLTSVIGSIMGADGLQMGTVYLASKEIVETGALSQIYQKRILEALPGSTIVTGESAGLRVRSLKTPKIEAICSLERDFATGSENESSFRRKIETLSAGSLFIAAKGMNKPDGEKLAESEIMKQGQFMSGACAGGINVQLSLRQIHENLAFGAPDDVLPARVSLRPDYSEPLSNKQSSFSFTSHQTSTMRGSNTGTNGFERIAITGMSVVNSLGASPLEIIQASLALKSGVTPVPSTKWNHEAFFSSKPRASEKTYCRYGAFQNLEISRKELGIPPQDFRTMAEATKITLWLAKNAILESNILASDIPRDRIGVLISQNSGEAASTLEQMIIRGCSEKILSDIKRALNLTPDQEALISEEIKQKRMGVDDTTLLGRLNCSAGGFICNKYGFMGPSFSVSAACATSLVALYSAYQMIRNGIIDAAVVGGGEELLTPMHFLEFSALGALAGLSGANRSPGEASRPFDADRDGMVLGEGGAMIIIERESIALKRGANILAFITSMGASNNNLGMIESSRSTQEIAIRASFKDCSYGPESVDLIECHATSTKQGDVEEVQGLKSIFNSGRPPVLTSFKSQIGHTLGASGLNSLIRGVMAMRSKVFSPTINYCKPDPEIGMESAGFRVMAEPSDWRLSNGKPRRFQVNAFGFGGSNYVVQIEESQNQEAVRFSPSPEKLKISVDKRPRVKAPDGIHFFRSSIAGEKYRIAVIAESEAAAVEMIQNEDLTSSEGAIGDKRLKVLARQGMHIGSSNMPIPGMAFVFPGQGSHYAGMGHELYNNFPVIRDWMNRAADVAEFDILKLLFYDKEEDLQKTRWQQPALFTLEYAMVQHFISLGAKATALAGHSLGELTALCLAGVYSFDDGFRIVNKRAVCMDKACKMNVDPGIMVACDAPLDVVNQILSQAKNVYITNINSPRQIVIGGAAEESKAISARLKEMGYRSTVLRVSMAFHSPIMRCIHDELREFIDTVDFHPPKVPVISNTTMKPFPDDAEEIKGIVMAHLESPVHWLQNVKTLWNEFDVRLFVEVGPREVLSNLIQDTIEEAQCIQTCLPSAESLMCKTAVAQLYSKGILPIDEVRDLTEDLYRNSHIEVVENRNERPLERTANSRVSIQTDFKEIIQKEINSFVIETFGRFIRPSILRKIRTIKDPKFSEADLDRILGDSFGASPTPSLIETPHNQTQLTIAQQEPMRSTAPEPESSEPDTTETIIRIIMEVTGYDRDEIEPHMDLREDLAIRSSRLPVIMDAVESRFKIKIELEDFMDVRTIKDLSDRLDMVVSRKAPSVVKEVSVESEIKEPEILETPKEILKRLTFSEVPLTGDSFQPLELSPMDSVIVIGPSSSEEFCRNVGDVFRRDYGVRIDYFFFGLSQSDKDENIVDLLSDSGLMEIKDAIRDSESPAGIVFVTDEAFEARFSETATLTNFLTGFFILLQQFIQKSSKKMSIYLQSGSESPNTFMEAVTGVFLSAALEYSSVLFRTVFVDSSTDIRTAIRSSMDRSKKPVQIICRNEELYTLQGNVAPFLYQTANKQVEIGENDVVLISGGLSGVSAELGRAFAPFGPKLIFVGRTSIDSKSSHYVNDHKTSLILKVLEELQSAGLRSYYYQLDVTDSGSIHKVMDRIRKEHGKITGVIHGAGLLKDNFIHRMPPNDFSSVVNVKFLGALNLFNALDKTSLKFFVALSSAAAIQGNPGQVNYAAANRMMSAFIRGQRSFHPKIHLKALMLPPIEGVGMAENAETRELMRRMNASYISLEELRGMFLREIFIASRKDSWSLFMKNLPCLSSAPLDTQVENSNEIVFDIGSVDFRKADFPMLDSVPDLDMDKGSLRALRIFDQQKDPWVVDHKPFKFMKHPIVSAIMAVETFMEASKTLFPYLNVIGLKEARFLDVIECPPHSSVQSQIFVAKVLEERGLILCDSIMCAQKGKSGKTIEKAHPNFKAQIMMAGNPITPAISFEGFPVRPEELNTRPMEHDEVMAWYSDRSDLKGRYRVMERFDGTGPDCIRGEFTYRHSNDFATPLRTVYQFSPYLFEAFMHLINFYFAMRDDHDKRSLIPFGINELRCFRKISDGERIMVEARKKSGDEKGVMWDALGLDASGSVVMYSKGIKMIWISGLGT
jgi:malonyl CoA-acyl carrier protein transacylase